MLPSAAYSCLVLVGAAFYYPVWEIIFPPELPDRFGWCDAGNVTSHFYSTFKIHMPNTEPRTHFQGWCDARNTTNLFYSMFKIHISAPEPRKYFQGWCDARNATNIFYYTFKFHLHKFVQEISVTKEVNQNETICKLPNPRGFCYKFCHNKSDPDALHSVCLECKNDIDEIAGPSFKIVPTNSDKILQAFYYTTFTLCCLAGLIMLLEIIPSVPNSNFPFQPRPECSNSQQGAGQSEYLENFSRNRTESREQRQRRARARMLQETRRRAQQNIINMIGSLTNPLQERTRIFNEWLETPD